MLVNRWTRTWSILRQHPLLNSFQILSFSFLVELQEISSSKLGVNSLDVLFDALAVIAGGARAGHWRRATVDLLERRLNPTTLWDVKVAASSLDYLRGVGRLSVLFCKTIGNGLQVLAVDDHVKDGRWCRDVVVFNDLYGAIVAWLLLSALAQGVLDHVGVFHYFLESIGKLVWTFESLVDQRQSKSTAGLCEFW